MNDDIIISVLYFKNFYFHYSIEYDRFVFFKKSYIDLKPKTIENTNCIICRSIFNLLYNFIFMCINSNIQIEFNAFNNNIANYDNKIITELIYIYNFSLVKHSFIYFYFFDYTNTYIFFI